ncbi:MAG: ACT domain-containing protein [Rhodothermales bacterium]|nr:ACT domain-containing protein [Rhodothermales bacterium]
MNLEWYPDDYWAWRLPAGETGPSDAFTVMRTPDETTVITTDPGSPADTPRSGPWRLFRIADTLPHDAVGILAQLSAVLADVAIPILAFGSYDTDYVFIPADREADARQALTVGGYTHL